MDQQGAADGLENVILSWLAEHHADAITLDAFIGIEQTLLRSAAALWLQPKKVGHVRLDEKKFIVLAKRMFAETRVAAVRAGDLDD